MKPKRSLLALATFSLLLAIAWLGGSTQADREKAPASWNEVAPGVWRSPGHPAGHALVDGDHALLIDVPHSLAEVKGFVKTIDAVYLTHHHRDSSAHTAEFLRAGVPVHAAETASPWLTIEGVKKYWRESLPLRTSRTAYLVHPEGFEGVKCELKGGQSWKWRGWTIGVVATPGHTQDHLAFTARKGEGPLLVFCGDALASSGKLWSPYTTDWDHWTNLGLKPTGESLRNLAALKPAVLLPAHGDVITGDCAGVLTRTAEAVEEMSFLKSFERFTKQRLGNEPNYRFLVKDQAESNGSKPWSRVSEHLWLTGNTYVLLSKSKDILVFDPWDPHSAKQIPKLREDQKLGKLEVVLFSHAHYDHYDGIHTILQRDKPLVWTLDHVAIPLVDPFKLRAPFLDVRPIRFDRLMKDGETATWREYSLKFRYLPGQTDFTMGVETVIDGKRCFFTADNWFHQDQFSGSGGWMGLNRSHPLLYATSAQKVLDAKPEWVLAEHGGAFEFNAEDFRRRVEWGKVSGKAADALCPSGSLLHDWDPHRVRLEPILHTAKAGAKLKAELIVSNPLGQRKKLQVQLEGRGLLRDQAWTVELKGGEVREKVLLELGKEMREGRHVFALRVLDGEGTDPSDAFVAVDVGK